MEIVPAWRRFPDNEFWINRWKEIVKFRNDFKDEPGVPCDISLAVSVILSLRFFIIRVSFRSASAYFSMYVGVSQSNQGKLDFNDRSDNRFSKSI